MDRRRFLRRALFGAGIVASGGGIDLLERIVEPRRYWPGADFERGMTPYGISEEEFPRWRPYRQESAIITHYEVEEDFANMIRLLNGGTVL